MHEQKHIVETVKTGIIEGIRGTGEVVDAAIDTVSGTLVNTLKGTGAVGAALTGTVSDVLRGAILGTAHVGADIRGAAKGGVIGVIRSTREVGVEATESIGAGARAVVKSAAEVGGDLGSAAQPLSKKATVIIARYRKHDLLIARPLGQSFAPPRDGSTSHRRAPGTAPRCRPADSPVPGHE